MADRRRRGKRVSQKVRALLAAGVVLGLGGASTLAAWTDYENASATFTAGTFGIVGSIDGNNFLEHPAESPAQLTFGVPANELVPGSVVYAAFSVRTADGSAAGIVNLAADAANGSALGAYLTYGVSATAGGCDAGAFNAGEEIVARGSALTAAPDASKAKALDASGGSMITYCFEVSMSASTSNDAQGLSIVPRWVVNAENT